MIVQELREIQHRCGWLPPEELIALSKRIGQPLHRLHEVASFFPHYRLKPGPKVHVQICRDMACHLRGSANWQRSFESLANEIDPTGKELHVDGVSCLGQCDRAPAAVINDHVYFGVSEQQLKSRVKAAVANEPLPHQRADRTPLGWRIDPYNGEPRYEAAKKLIGTLDYHGVVKGADDVIGQIKAAELRGMGGARFPTWRKWDSVKKEPGDEKYIVCNGDEAEPGTFKDRELIRRTPWLLVEGMLLAGLCVGARHGYIYIRHEYEEEIEAMEECIREAQAAGIVGDNVLGTGLTYELEVYVSPGGYICGEESALLEAMEDRRAEPRNKPPFPFQNGFRGKPTVINNVETLMWTPAIVVHGPEWYRDQGVRGAKGLWFTSIAGDLNEPGVYEIPFGTTVRELLTEAGGMRDGQKLKALGPSGPSGGFLPASIKAENLPEKFRKENMRPGAKAFNLLDLPLDPDVLTKMGSMLGAAITVVGDKTDMVDMALNLTSFFRNESCGKCVPCRVGSQKLTDILTALMKGQSTRDQLTLGDHLGHTMIATSICGLGQVAPNPLLTLLTHFPEEVERYLQRSAAAAPAPMTELR